MTRVLLAVANLPSFAFAAVVLATSYAAIGAIVALGLLIVRTVAA